MIVPKKPGDASYSVEIRSTYLIFLNTSEMDETTEAWLVAELDKAKSFTWVLIFG